MPNTSTLPFGNSSAMSSSAPVTDIGDSAMRKHVDPKLSAATAWPFARGVA